MDRGIDNSIKGVPSSSFEAALTGTTLVKRLGQPPMNRLSCVNQHANIRLINYRGQFPFPFRYAQAGFTLNYRGDLKKIFLEGS
jgi:hypothetical protein